MYNLWSSLWTRAGWPRRTNDLQPQAAMRSWVGMVTGRPKGDGDEARPLREVTVIHGSDTAPFPSRLPLKSQAQAAWVGVHYRGVQWEGGAVERGSIMW